MSMRAKVLVPFAKPGENIDVFVLVERIEKAINAIVREAAKALRVDDEPLGLTMRREKIARPETQIRPPFAGCRCLYTQFSMGRYERRLLQVIIDPADQAILPEKGAVLLSLGMNGQYREILSACAKALAPEGGYFYGDDSFDGFITDEQLQQKMAEEALLS